MWLALEARLVAANGLGVMVVYVYVERLLGQYRSDTDRDHALVLIGLYFGLLLPVAVWNNRRIAAVTWQVLRRGRLDRREDQRHVLATPWRWAGWASTYWIGAVVVFGLFSGFSSPAFETQRIVAGIALSGVVTCAVVFLLVERYMRPAFALALTAGLPPERTRLGIRPRLVLFWLLGSGVPLAAIAAGPFGLPENQREGAVAAQVVLALVGFLTGLVVMLAAARSVSDPLARVRAALHDVEVGNLDTRVEVDDGGDTGILQAGFNRMVTGLQERRLLEDLFGRHVGPDVLAEALAGHRELGGELREAAALFVDVVGSTATATVLSPREVVDMLNAFFSAVVRVVTEEGGWVNKFHGDGALCVFGVPAERPDAAAAALRAARRIEAEVRRLRERLPALQAAVGVSWGTVVAGNVGAEERYEYTIIGDPVNEAARLCERAKGRPLQVVASEGIVARAGEEAERWVSTETITLRGRSDPTGCYEPVTLTGDVTAVAPPLARARRRRPGTRT